MTETVFISAVIGGLEAVQQAAREAVESLGMRPVMAEMAGARPQSPQQALLGEVADADSYLLLLGARYGEPGASGVSASEEEFEEANRRNKPIVILRQNVAMESQQRSARGCRAEIESARTRGESLAAHIDPVSRAE